MFLDRLARIVVLPMIVLDSCNFSQLQDSCVALALHLGSMALDFSVFKKISIVRKFWIYAPQEVISSNCVGQVSQARSQMTRDNFIGLYHVSFTSDQTLQYSEYQY